jgi:hypothetical protein
MNRNVIGTNDRLSIRIEPALGRCARLRVIGRTGWKLRRL